jgi:hypothetical protein
MKFSHAQKRKGTGSWVSVLKFSPGNAPGKAHQARRAADGRKSRGLAAWMVLAIIFAIYAYFAPVFGRMVVPSSS